MDTKVIPIERTSLGDELAQVTLHDNEAQICNSKVLDTKTAPGIKLFHAEHSNIINILYRGRKLRMPITNIKCMYLK